MIDAQVKLKFNKPGMEVAARKAFHELNNVLGRNFQERVTGKIWAWPQPTVVVRGGVTHVEGSPRDIVDIGNLRDSYDARQVSATHYRHVWDVEYALAVHNGALIRNAWGRGITVILTARPWVRVTLREVPVSKVWQALLAAEIQKVKAPA